MVHHLTDRPTSRAIRSVQLGFGERFDHSAKVSGKSFYFSDPGLDVTLIDVLRSLEVANRIAQWVQIGCHPSSLNTHFHKYNNVSWERDGAQIEARPRLASPIRKRYRIYEKE